MFGLVAACPGELTPEEKSRYLSYYCGICRAIRGQCSQLCRLALSYDMVFLALVLSSLYEPEESQGEHACLLHPLSKRSWVQNAAISYAADMNIALAYYSADDHWRDDHSLPALGERKLLRPYWEEIQRRYPRQCRVIGEQLGLLSKLEQEKSENPDLAANCFGELMAELFLWRQDRWEPVLRAMGHHLGRFVYLADAVIDLKRDRRSGSYNPLLLLSPDRPASAWEPDLVLAMSDCVSFYERLPLVQDKALMDKILYSGVWAAFHSKIKKEREDKG